MFDESSTDIVEYPEELVPLLHLVVSFPVVINKFEQLLALVMLDLLPEP